MKLPAALNPWTPIPAATARTPHSALTQTALPGLNPQWSKLVTAKTDDGERTFHVLDTGDELAARGITPTGTVIAVHGNPTWSYLWRDLLAASLDHATEDQAWRVIAPDQLDMGFSERLAHDTPPSPGNPSYRSFAQRLQDLDGLMDVLDVEIDKPVVTLGHDWGGVISLAWAARHHRMVDAVMTLNTGVYHPVDEVLPAALRAALAPGVLAGGTVLSDTFLRVTLALAEHRLDPEVLAAYRAPYVSARGRGGIGGFVADIPATSGHRSRGTLESTAAALQQWEKPALVIWGPKDPVFQERHLADLMERIPHADLHRCEGSGHLVGEDRDIAGMALTWLGDQFHPPHAGTAPQSPPPAGTVSGMHEQLEAMSLSWRADSAAAVELGGETLQAVSWKDLREQVDVLAAGLHRQGVRPGDRVSLLVQPGNQLTVILYACLRLGAVAVVADAGLGLKGMTRAVRSARPEWVIGQRPGLTVARALRWPGRRISVDALSPRLAALLGTVASVERLLRGSSAEDLHTVPYPDPDAEAAVLFTSGSTGPAKGVMYTHRRLGALVTLIREQFSVKPGASLIAGFAPFALLGPAIGATSVTPDMTVTKPATLTAQAVAQAAAAGEATMFFGSPAALRNVVATAGELSDDQREALHRIRVVLSAGAPVHPDLLQDVQEIFRHAEIHTPYGMTEGLLQADIHRQQIISARNTEQPGVCVGKPVAGVEFALAPLDDQGRPAESLVDPDQAPGVLSEIVVSAAHLKQRYDKLWFTERESTRDQHRGLRWHRTGDIGHIDAEGRLWIQGRLHHVITTPQGPIGPGVVETPVDALEGVARSAAVGVGPAGTQAVTVVLEPAPGHDLRHGSSVLADPQVAQLVRETSTGAPVSAVLVTDQLPTDIRHNSKIDRTAVAQWATELLAGQGGH